MAHETGAVKTVSGNKHPLNLFMEGESTELQPNAEGSLQTATFPAGGMKAGQCSEV